MRTPEQAEQFKKDYLAQIDVNSLNKVEKVLYNLRICLKYLLGNFARP